MQRKYSRRRRAFRFVPLYQDLQRYSIALLFTFLVGRSNTTVRRTTPTRKICWALGATASFKSAYADIYCARFH